MNKPHHRSCLRPLGRVLLKVSGCVTHRRQCWGMLLLCVSFRNSPVLHGVVYVLPQPLVSLAWRGSVTTQKGAPPRLAPHGRGLTPRAMFPRARAWWGSYYSRGFAPAWHRSAGIDFDFPQLG